MTKVDFESMTFEDLMDYAKENIDCVTDEETLKGFAIEKIESDDFNLGIHILLSIYSKVSLNYETEFYRYDYSMGTLETPTPITEKSDIEDLIDFDN